MIPYERRQIMLAEMERNELVNLDDFQRALPNISKSTIRRDLKTLENEGQIVLLRGGAAKMKTGSYDTPLNSRNLIHVKEKEAIARTAAELVKDGEAIYIDAGSTCLRMIAYLRGKDITIVTTNAIIFPEIVETDLKCTMVGGDILKSTASVVGPLTDKMLGSLFFDKAFIGTTGYDIQAGISTPDSREANKKSIVRANAKETYVLADTSKEGVQAMCRAFGLEECTLIVDRETDLLRENAKYIVAR